jgi:hypothetical protein
MDAALVAIAIAGAAGYLAARWLPSWTSTRKPGGSCGCTHCPGKR